MYDWVSFVYLAGVVISAICILLVIYQRPSKEQNVATMVSICCALIWLGYWIGITSTSLEQLVIGKKLNYIGSIGVYYFIILFCIKYYHLSKLEKLMYVLTPISLFFIVITSTFDKHKLYYSYYAIDTSSPIPDLATGYTFLHTLYLVMIIAYSLLAIGITIREIKKKSDVTENLFNTLSLLAFVLVPSLCYVVDKIVDPIVSLVPFGLLFAELNLLYLVCGSKICNVNTLVRDFVFETIDEAIIVVDRKMRYREANKVAMDAFRELRSAVVGDYIEHASKEVAELFEKKYNSSEDYLIEKNGRIFNARLRTMNNNFSAGWYVMWLQDVTVQQDNIHLLENYQRDLEREVDEKTARLQKMQEQMINGFSTLVENKNFVTGGHVQRTSAYAYAIARELQKEEAYPLILTPSYCKKIRMVAPLHDIGKISIPDSILDKPGKLTPEEFATMQTHSEMGAMIIEKIMSENDDKEYIQLAKDIARYHHEKWNGEGYPKGLSGNDIPLAARIMAVADVFDALVSERPYKKAFTIDEAFSIIASESGSHFDPKVNTAFLKIRQEITG